MIQSYMLDGTLVADGLPQVGDTIYLVGWGETKVFALYHTNSNNYITLQVVSSETGGMSEYTVPFSVKEK